MSLFLLLLAILLLWGLRVAEPGEFHKDFMSLKATKGIQGFCAMCIIVHHFSQNMLNLKENPGVLIGFQDIGYLFVGIFFFFSGYGLVKSYETKSNYLNGFLKHRLPVVLVPFYIINAIFTIVVLATGDNLYIDMNPLCFGFNSLLFKITTFLGFTLMNSNGWFMITISIFYIAFYLIFKVSTNEKTAFKKMGIFLLIYVLICMPLGSGPFWFMGEWWYNTCLLFFVGMLNARYEKDIIEYIKEKYTIMLAGSFIGTVVTTLLTILALRYISYYRPGLIGIGGCFVCLVIQTISSVFFIAFILILTMKVKLNNNMLDFVGSIALEIYLVHRMFLQCFKSKYLYLDNNVLYLMLVYIFTIFAAILIHKLDTLIVKLIRNKK